MKFSVIIPTKNEEKYLPRLLDGLKRQTVKWGKDFEVIVIDGHSSDRTVEIAKSYGCRVRKTRVWPIGKVRNIGARMAKGKYLVFLDADVEVLPRFLEDVGKKLDAYSAVLYVTKPGNNLSTLLFSILNTVSELVSCFLFVWIHPGGGMAVKACDFWEVGGFDENLVISEDRDLLKKLVALSGDCSITAFCRISPRRYGSFENYIKSEFALVFDKKTYWKFSKR